MWQETACPEGPEQVIQLLELLSGFRIDIDLVSLFVGLFCQAAGKQRTRLRLAVL
jgi:hypothetical protein